MNRGFWLAGLMAMAPVSLRAQAKGFEGSISMTMQAGGQTIPMDYKLKGHKARVELHMPSRNNIVLIDLDAHTQTILIPEFKAYAVHNGDAASSIASATPPTVTDLGTTEKIAGYTCEDYKLAAEKYEGTACMTKEFGENALTDSMNGPLGSTLKDEALRKAGMPLKLDIAFKETGKLGDKASMEVTKVAPGPVEEADFEIPDGWHKLNGLPGMP